MQGNFLEQCESEKLHKSGCIQPHGALVVVDLNGTVRHLSDNVEDFFSEYQNVQIGKQLPQELYEDFVSLNQDVGKHHFLDFRGQRDEPILITVCFSETEAIFELYPDINEAQRIDPFLFPSLLNDQQDVDYWRNKLLLWVSEITQHERTMYYQFVEQGDGVVIDEIRSETTEGTYLDLRFPASDVPNIARQLYVKNPWRMIPDASEPSVTIKGQSTSPDLTYTDLRSLSPVHQVYMQNMGVVSSVSFPIVRNGELDALISCHSTRKRLIARCVLIRISETLGHFSSLLKEFDIRQRMQAIDEFNYKNERVRSILASEASIEVILEKTARDLLDNFEVDGITFCTDQDTYSYGESLDKQTLEQIDSWFCEVQGELIFHTDNLNSFLADPPLTEVAGVCGLKFRSPQVPGNLVRVYLCRGEHIYEVKWGGNPNKPSESHDGQYGISPRQSFSKWVERRLGYCKPWPAVIKIELHRLRSILETSSVFSGK